MKTFSKAFWSAVLVVWSLIFTGCANQRVTGDGKSEPSHTANTQSVAVENKPTPTPVKAQSNVLFIIDSSGSMKASVEGKTKMDTAKEVLNELIGTLSPETNAGLLAYGHRAKDDCKDAELLVPVVPVKTDLFRQKVQSLEPLGQTPISYSLVQAAEYLKGKTGKKSIILISDGEETCNADPCKVAAELKKADINVKIHVVGFGIEKESAKKQLHCIADATGGTYKDAANAGELKSTLEKIAAAEPAAEKGRLLTVSRNSQGEPVNWKLQVFLAGQPDKRITDNLGGTGVNELPPGVYDLYYWTTGVPSMEKKNVEIKAGQETRVEFPDFGRLRISQKDENGSEVISFPEVYRNGERYLSFRSSGTQELQPGIYDVYCGAMGFSNVWRKGVEIKPGQETLVEIILTK